MFGEGEVDRGDVRQRPHALLEHAKRARVPQAGAWADPTVSLSYAGNAAPPFTVMDHAFVLAGPLNRQIATRPPPPAPPL